MNPKRKEPNLSTYAGRCGARLRMLRERKGLSVETVASILGISERAIYHWESGQRDLPLEIMPKLASLYGLKSPQFLLSPK